MCADNDLSGFVEEDVAELKALSLRQFIQVDQRYAGWEEREPNSFRIRRQVAVRNFTNREGYGGLSLWLPRTVRPHRLEAYDGLPFLGACPSYRTLLRGYVRPKGTRAG